MRYFYEMYPNAGIHPQLVDELSASENRPQSVDDLESIFYIPWGHNVNVKPLALRDNLFFDRL